MLYSTRIFPKSWSSTLQLPRSAFPARAIVADRPKYLQRCTDDLYTWQRHELRNKERFTLHDGPPYANGSLHIGHALNKILKDITCRFQLSQGRGVDYVPGWDCHGLPIEHKALEKQMELGALGTGHQQLSAVAVRDAARLVAAETVEEQKKSFQGWGIMADWDHAWKTMDKGFEVGQLSVFKEMVKKGLIYRRFKPVYWSPALRTALAEAELEYKEDHVSTAVFVTYSLQALSSSLIAKLGAHGRNISAVIWTTTPWTLPANRAIGIHSDLDYAIVESANHGLLLLAKSRVTEMQTEFNESLKVVVSVRGSELVGTTYKDFAFSKTSPPRPILHADFVSAESGSGLVHVAPGHGMEDYKLCLANGIEPFAPLDDSGCFTALAMLDNPRVLSGMPVLTTGSQTVLEHMTKIGHVLGQHRYTHKYPYDWRSKQPVILRATEQWFADVGEIREAALKSLDEVTFIPEGGKERLTSFVKNRSEWCISRQRAWGVPLPAIYHQDTGEAVLTEESVSHIISTIEDRGIDAWWTDEDLDPSWTPPSLRYNSGRSPYKRGKDTMDVWFDSGTSWTQTAASNDESERHVADVYLEGTDQHRGWFQSSLLTHIAHQNKDTATAPFRTLITHGFTLDQHSRKMSKSIGNVTSPDEIMEGTLLPPMRRKPKSKSPNAASDQQVLYDAMGPDALRLWAASCDYTKDVVVSQTVLKAINSNLSKYRVTFKMLLGMLEDSTAFTDFKIYQLNTINQIALVQLKTVVTSVRQHYKNFEFNRSITDINKYINSDLSGSYIESIKDIIYADGTNSLARAETQYTLRQIYTQLQAMLAPVTPLLVEETIAYTPKQLQSQQRMMWLKAEDGDEAYWPWQNKRLELDLPFLLQANAAVKKAQEAARGGKKMGSSLQSSVMLQCDKSGSLDDNSPFNILSRYSSDLETLFVVSEVDIYIGDVPANVATADWSYKTEFGIAGSKVVAHVYSPQNAKCVRCWRYAVLPEFKEQDAVCNRCKAVVEELREGRPELFQEGS